MSADEKVRTSGESPSAPGAQSGGSVLPTVNPAVKPEPAKPTLHPAFYVV